MISHPFYDLATPALTHFLSLPLPLVQYKKNTIILWMVFFVILCFTHTLHIQDTIEDSEYTNFPVHMPTNNQKQEHQQRNCILISMAHAQSSGKKKERRGQFRTKNECKYIHTYQFQILVHYYCCLLCRRGMCGGGGDALKSDVCW